MDNLRLLEMPGLGGAGLGPFMKLLLLVRELDESVAVSEDFSRDGAL
jgi:hypothetical protein